MRAFKFVIAAVLVGIAIPASAAPGISPYTKSLIQQWQPVFYLCRQPVDESKEGLARSEAACRIRDAIGAELDRQGLCPFVTPYGPDIYGWKPYHGKKPCPAFWRG